MKRRAWEGLGGLGRAKRWRTIGQKKLGLDGAFLFQLFSLSCGTSRSTSLRVGQDEFEEFEEPDWAWSSVDGTIEFRIMSNWNRTCKKNEVYATLCYQLCLVMLGYAWLC